MDSMYAVSMSWFRVTGKYQYARICVDYIYAIHAVNPAVRDLGKDSDMLVIWISRS